METTTPQSVSAAPSGPEITHVPESTGAAPQGGGAWKIVLPIVFVLLAAAIAAFWYISQRTDGSLSSTETPLRIGFSLGTLREERWQRDIDLFTERAEELGAVVIPAYANDDASVQIQQAENLILQKVDVLVVVAQDGAAAAEIVARAHAAGIKVVAYDRLIAHPELDLFVTFDSRVVGQLEAEEIVRRVPKGTYAYIGGSTTDNNAFLHKEGAMRVLQPLIDKGDITLAVDAFSPGWRPDEAYKTMKTYLDTGKNVDAVVSANDGTAGGVIQALQEKGLAGTVPVAGQDADLAACQRIVAGTQAVTVYKPIATLAAQAAEDAITLARGSAVTTNTTIKNGDAMSPARLLIPTLVTKETLDETVIEDGFHERDAVYQ